MPKKPYFKDYPYYVILYHHNGETHTQMFVGAECAVDAFRQMQEIYGYSCMLLKVVATNGEKI